MTFEELIEEHLLSLVQECVEHELTPSDSSAADTVRVAVCERTFEYGPSRTYYLNLNEPLDSTGVVAYTFQVAADVLIHAVLEFFTAQRLDLESLIEALLAQGSVVWTWYENEIRVEQRLLSTRLTEGGGIKAERMAVAYRAPCFKRSDWYRIRSESWFDGWNDLMLQFPSGEAYVDREYWKTPKKKPDEE